MSRLLILSGKGGTGKTTVAAAFVELARAAAYADCDVDAPNLHLVTPTTADPERFEYVDLPRAWIDPTVCVGCGACAYECRYDAVLHEHGTYRIDQRVCEGCALCAVICPVEAIALQPVTAGDVIVHHPGRRVFSTGELRMGHGSSGKLVAEVKSRLPDAAPDEGVVVLDGPPGIGCPVMASLTGVDAVLVVAESSRSGLHDLDRVLDAVAGSGARVAVAVNRAGLDEGHDALVQARCEARGVPVIGTIPGDPTVVRVTDEGRTLATAPGPAADAVRALYTATVAMLQPRSTESVVTPSSRQENQP